MVVETMTDLELLTEVLKDFKEIADFYESIRHNTTYKKRLQWGRPKDGQFVFRINDWKSAGGNTYTFIIKTTGWNEFKIGHFLASSLLFFKRNNAQNALRIIFDHDNNPGIEIFTSHFADRYNQRFLKQPFLSRKEVILQYVDRNSNAVIHELDSPKYDFGVMVATSDGYTFGKYEHKDIMVNKTFVSRDMLYGGQYDTADFLDEAVLNAINGGKSNLFNADKELWDIINSEKAIPTIDDLKQTAEMIKKLKSKEESLDRVGKEYDLEYVEMNNQLSLWMSGFDWQKGQLKDEDGNIVNHPLMKMLSQVLKKYSE